MSHQQLPTILTMGEPSGIGGEVAIKAWVSAHSSLSPFCLIDSPTRMAKLASLLNIEIPLVEISNVNETGDAFERGLPILSIELAEDPIPGELNPKNGPAVIAAIDQGVALVQSGVAGAIVTNPIHKQALYQCGFSHPGHTEYLATLAGITTEPVMMLASDRLRVIPVTRHIGVQAAINTLTPDLICETALITNRALERDFGITSPRIAVAALNPHAGEGGVMGDEEATLIEPAIQELKAKGLSVSGPHPPDTLFHASARENYDVVLCMYHDQALIPIKTLDFDTAVNVTLGLPFIRTSPDHGTALDIAGTGRANEQSLIAALQMAGEMAQNRNNGQST
ncbi:MAG: 4-hydroxythreonine-4-phosphate dehydrogenase PdxA [Rhodospirillaceae bacterium]|jgi:4-hydroxythreonine-4-phosphate dehydrogenase|nr:4-hydroxythreonine-4-phosphate dehydrogenase PdxA [Rhodospirillaceae bacterium]MBT4588937.1 4-hydroxythreonine-4-phosphate dehydrogenase PdxA [Rhodospirillaceae bacterium]MBT5941711.1 4-hydroxythreonine-4-phosphate dehydrogenase PdxA [Rhodospirillaceae bacterium]MBT7267238.1 4-hydroxythreonine-4-phosphate dehydrogenase PdxA [Rhodospirillaceae bacterium]